MNRMMTGARRPGRFRASEAGGFGAKTHRGLVDGWCPRTALGAVAGVGHREGHREDGDAQDAGRGGRGGHKRSTQNRKEKRGKANKINAQLMKQKRHRVQLPGGGGADPGVLRWARLVTPTRNELPRSSSPSTRGSTSLKGLGGPDMVGAGRGLGRRWTDGNHRGRTGHHEGLGFDQKCFFAKRTQKVH